MTPILPNKHSLSRTLHHQTLRYLTLYKVQPRDIKRKKDLNNLIDSIFFFWIKSSSDEDYLWSETSTSLFFLAENSDEIKKIIEQKITEQLGNDKLPSK